MFNLAPVWKSGKLLNHCCIYITLLSLKAKGRFRKRCITKYFLHAAARELLPQRLIGIEVVIIKLRISCFVKSSGVMKAYFLTVAFPCCLLAFRFIQVVADVWNSSKIHLLYHHLSLMTVIKSITPTPEHSSSQVSTV